jgi:hypothetical protein
MRQSKCPFAAFLRCNAETAEALFNALRTKWFFGFQATKT